MPKSLRRLTLTSLTLCLFALPTAVTCAQDKPGQQPPPPSDSGGAVPGPPRPYPNPDHRSLQHLSRQDHRCRTGTSSVSMMEVSAGLT